MSIIILIPFAICLYMLTRESAQRVFLDVYLPAFMLLPGFYYWKVAALPPVDFLEAVLLPLGVAIACFELRRWRPTTMDLWMVFFIISTFYADYEADKQTTAIFDLFAVLTTALVPYMCGKLLIEQHNNRIATLKRIVFLLSITCVISAYEYRMGQNPFSLFFARFFPGESFLWKTQIRWGFGRVSGPFAQSELAGIVLVFGLVLALYLAYYHLWERRFRYLERFPIPVPKAATLTLLIAFSLFMTQARGPWLGCFIAVPVALIGRSKRVLRRALFTIVILGVGGALAYVGLKRLTSGPTTSESQESAQYRAQLVSNYLPVVQQGGIWGWGVDFPRAGGEGSIDNEYLYLALTQGYIGAIAFILIGVESILRAFASALYAPEKPDRYFAWSILGILLGTMLIVGTVFLALQSYQLFFLLAGWSQSLPLRSKEHTQLSFESVYS